MNKNKATYILLFIFLLITFFGILANFFDWKEVWDIYSVLDTSSSVALAVLAFFGYMEYISLEDVINIYFEVDEKKIDTKLSLLRKDFSRAEILGLLGMIQGDVTTRFEIQELKDVKILNYIQKIQKGKDKKFILKLTKTELKQFDIKG